MKLVVISDTHGKHNNLSIPIGDVLIHSGDYSMFGRYNETKDFLDWFQTHPHPHKIIVAGNHEVGICPLKNDVFDDNNELKRIWLMIDSYKINFLIDKELIIDGIKFWGSPWCGGEKSIMYKWGFFLHEDNHRKTKFNMIPDDTYVLITHSPPFGILDGDNLGCQVLSERVKQVKPIIHIFGHIHNSYGIHYGKYTDSYNCSNMNDLYKIVNSATIINI